MTLLGAIEQLHELRSAKEMPVYYQLIIAEVINTLLMDTQEVKHGRWKVLASGNNAICTNCEQYWIPNGDQYDYHYCPNCGAKMNEVEE